MNNPADTLAALAPCPFCGGEARVIESRLAAWSTPTFAVGCEPCNMVFCENTQAESIAAWNRRASLKGEAEPGFRDSVLSSARFRAACYKLVGIVEGVESQGRQWVSGGQRIKDTPEWCAFYVMVANMRNGTTPPAPQAVGEAVVQGSKVGAIAAAEQDAKIGGTGFLVDGIRIAPDRVQMIVTNPTPSPAPQGGGNRRQAVIDAIRRDLDATGAATIRYAELEMLLATPPAQQPGEVGEDAVKSALATFDKCVSAFSEFDVDARHACMRAAILEAAALAPKEKGNG